MHRAVSSSFPSREFNTKDTIPWDLELYKFLKICIESYIPELFDNRVHKNIYFSLVTQQIVFAVLNYNDYKNYSSIPLPSAWLSL